MMRRVICGSILALGVIACSGASGVKAVGESEFVLLTQDSVVTLRVDTGGMQRTEVKGEPLAYFHQPVSGDRHLLSFIDRELVPGFVVLDEELSPRLAVHGATAWRFGDDLLMGVAIAEPIERMAAESEVSLWSLTDFRLLFQRENTIPMPPIAFDYRNPHMEPWAGGNLLLLTYKPARRYDPNYPWERRLTFSFLSPQTGTLLWRSEVDPGFQLAGLDLLWQDDEVLLLAGRVDLYNYYYLCLEASSGDVRWQEKRMQFPLTKTDYPYALFSSVFPAHRDGDELAFAALDIELPYRKVAYISLRDGELRMNAEVAELKAMQQAYLSLYPAPEPLGSSEYELDDLGVLTIVPYEYVELVGSQRNWRVRYLPQFGGGVEPVAWGERRIVLVERAGRSHALGYQGKGFVLETATGKEARLPKGAIFFEPWSPQEGTRVILTTQELLEMTSEEVRKHSFTLKEASPQ